MFNIFSFIWYDVLYQPLYNLLMFFYVFSPGKDMGLAVIFFTIFIRVLLLPFSVRGARSEIRLEQLQPLIEEVQNKYKHNLEKQREALRRLLKKNNISVFSNIFSLAFQIFFFFVLYEIFASGLQPGLGHNNIYKWLWDPGIVDPYFAERLNLILPSNRASLFAAGTMLFSQIIYLATQKERSTVDRIMLVALPVGIYFASVVLPAAKPLFIATSVIFSLWLLLIKTVVLRFIVKDEKLKQTIDDLWK